MLEEAPIPPVDSQTVEAATKEIGQLNLDTMDNSDEIREADDLIVLKGFNAVKRKPGMNINAEGFDDHLMNARILQRIAIAVAVCAEDIIWTHNTTVSYPLDQTKFYVYRHPCAKECQFSVQIRKLTELLRDSCRLGIPPPYRAYNRKLHSCTTPIICQRSARSFI